MPNYTLDLLTDEFLLEIGFKRVEVPGGSNYGKAIDVRTNGMTEISWNSKGHHCTYFGEVLNPNISLCIKKDAGTRTVFNGYVFSQEDIRKILSLTW